MRGMEQSFVVVLWVAFSAVVHYDGDFWTPEEMVLTLKFPTTEPVKIHVRGFNTLGGNSVVHETCSSGVVGLDGQLWLGPIHSSEGVL